MAGVHLELHVLAKLRFDVSFGHQSKRGLKEGNKLSDRHHKYLYPRLSGLNWTGYQDECRVTFSCSKIHKISWMTLSGDQRDNISAIMRKVAYPFWSNLNRFPVPVYAVARNSSRKEEKSWDILWPSCLSPSAQKGNRRAVSSTGLRRSVKGGNGAFSASLLLSGIQEY